MTKKTTRPTGAPPPALPSRSRRPTNTEQRHDLDRAAICIAAEVLRRVVSKETLCRKPMTTRDTDTGAIITRKELRRRTTVFLTRARCGLISGGRA